MEPREVKECQKEELHSWAKEDLAQTQGPKVCMETSTPFQTSKISLISKTN